LLEPHGVFVVVGAICRYIKSLFEVVTVQRSRPGGIPCLCARPGTDHWPGPSASPSLARMAESSARSTARPRSARARHRVTATGQRVER